MSDIALFEKKGFRSHWYKAIDEISLKSNLYFSKWFGNKLKLHIFGYVQWLCEFDLCGTWSLLKWGADPIDIKTHTNFHWNLTCTFLENLVTSQLLTDYDDEQIWTTKHHLVSKWQVNVLLWCCCWCQIFNFISYHWIILWI